MSIINGDALKVPDAVDSNLNDIDTIYQLFYIQHSKSTSTQCVQFKTKLKHFNDIVARTRKFCDILRWRFIRVQPFIIDLDREEQRHVRMEDPYAS